MTTGLYLSITTCSCLLHTCIRNCYVHAVQSDAKRAVANALRNRWRRHKIASPMKVSIGLDMICDFMHSSPSWVPCLHCQRKEIRGQQRLHCCLWIWQDYQCTVLHTHVGPDKSHFTKLLALDCCVVRLHSSTRISIQAFRTPSPARMLPWVPTCQHITAVVQPNLLVDHKPVSFASLHA